jgi:hypothetical protein
MNFLKYHLGPETNFLILSLIVFRQLRVCSCEAPSLTRGRVCSFQLLLSIASAVFLGLNPAGLMSFIFLSYIYIYIYIEREREREKRTLEVVVRDTTLEVGSRK